ncbi:hypothetical protein HLB23_28355 [Nocardia uniformis]|uniref:Uncharacterized protein n=1 Tax=Nocardia uniformis TaxID=53432 RepID=A0A849CBJ8_9NOCA|nr:hypothetical protein [Nocardia uniformis]NNH73720.1 hypothetical protein [Nocardia uniformis]
MPGELIVHGSANLLNRGLGDPGLDQELRDRRDLQVRVLTQADAPAEQRAHSWSVQEIVATSEEAAARELIQLADACGMTCFHTQPPWDAAPTSKHVAVARAESWASRTGHRFYVGLMWRPDIEAVPGTFQSYGRGRSRLWHCLAAVELDYGGSRMRACSWHADVFDPQWRISEAYQIAWIANNGNVPTLIGCDSNSLPASRVGVPWSRRWRRPWQPTTWSDPDPYPGTGWFPDRVHQLDPTASGVRGDRRADRILVDPQFGQLIDTAVEAGRPLECSTGHWPTDRHPPRRVDRIYGTHHFRGRVAGFEAISTDAAKRASDHLPVLAHVQLGDTPP